MQGSKVTASTLVLLMLTSVLLGLIPTPTHLDEAHIVQRTATVTDQTFTQSMTTITGDVGDTITPTVPVHYGYSMTDGTMNLTLQGSQTPVSTTYTVASGMLNGTLNATINDGSSIQLVSSAAGPPQAGSNSSTVLSATSLSGTHQYDTLELLCGISSCGSIVATGDLTLYVNTLRVEQGTSITANDLVTGGVGAGTSTTTATNGRNDGGGGAGHGGAGGAGGGTGGGSGGSAYGNGTERGSQGGGVSSSVHSAANGGNGGGYLRIFANQIFVNGSIHVNGGDGDAGSAPSSGTGHGGSGAGGGSGGAVFIQANSVLVGNGGQIKADGGDGGDGANGVQQGPGIMMYDGGDGGGGGAGGRIVINTQTGGYSNSGTVQAAAGSGGTKGSKYGTGSDGVDGSPGSAGTVTTGTWGGYVSTGNITADNGTFTSHPINTQTGQLSAAYLTHSTSVPADASLTATYRYTVNGTDASYSEWSDWEPLSLSGEWVPHHTWIQLEYTFARTGTASPALNSFSMATTAWPSLTSVDLAYDGETLEPALDHATFGYTNTLTDTSTPQQPQFTFDVPVGTTFSEELAVWMQWDGSTVSPPSFTQARIGTTVVNSTTALHAEEGLVLVIDDADLNQATPTNTYQDTHGMHWNTYTVSVDMSASTTVWFDRLGVPWSVELPVNMTAAMNNVILADCTTFYTFTSGTCFGQATLHRFSLTGTNPLGGSTAFSFTLSDPLFSWKDTYAPELSLIQHRKGIEQLPNLRVNESFSVVLFDVAGEDDLSVEYLGLDWQESDGFSASQPMAYHNGLKGYYIYLDTDGLEVDLEHEFNMTFRLLDAQGNELLPRPTYNITVYPAAPEISGLVLEGQTKLSGTTADSTWGISGANILLKVTEVNLRQNLVVMADLTHLGTSPPLTLPLVWDPALLAYSMDWQPQRQDMGEWNIEIRMEELGGLMSSDPNGWQDGVDAVVHLVDNDGPVITSIQFPSSLEPNEPLNFSMQWTTSEDETYTGSVAVDHEGIEVANKTIVATQANNASLMFTTDGWSAGIYTMRLYLTDDVGNEATQAFSEATTFEILKPFITSNLTLAYVAPDMVEVRGHVETRSGSALLNLYQENTDWAVGETVEDGHIWLNYTLDDFPSAITNLSLQACDSNNLQACELQHYELDISPAFTINATSTCQTPDINQTSAEEQTVVSCEVVNLGLTEITVQYNAAVLFNISSTETVIEPGETATVFIVLEAGEDDVNHSIDWTLLASNALANTSALDSGQVQVLRAIPEPTVNDSTDETASGDSNLVVVSLVGLLLAGAGVAFAFYRRSSGADILGIDEPKEHVELAQVEHGSTEEEIVSHDVQASTPEPQLERAGPSASTPPTSTDANGYEWYSTAEGHWYRTASSQGEWIPYEQP